MWEQRFETMSFCGREAQKRKHKDCTAKVKERNKLSETAIPFYVDASGTGLQDVLARKSSRCG